MNQMLNFDDYERRVRERAYQLWEVAGRPDGLTDHFWYEAQRSFEAEHPELALRHAGDPQPEEIADQGISLHDIA